ncbi:MAG TPA: hypothetical protein IAB65_01220 [Candidatus Onthocola stercorigallinarum]|nr:hypothetical protein [Candidatus Onthocola stercorigallinarum]
MKALSNEVKNLLDRLYNLRGEDSVILTKMNKEREEAIETQERTKNEKEVLLQEIERLSQDEKTLAEEGEKLTSVLSSINRDDFANVLERLKLDFEPAQLNEKVSSMLPNTISEIVSEKDAASKKLEEVETEMNNAITKVEELGIRKDEALSNQAKLNEYFDLALSGNINITRDAITSLLDKFDFSENDSREAAKLLMFPEDALYEYDASFKSGDKQSGKTISEVIAEAKQESKDQTAPLVAEPKEELNAPENKEQIEEVSEVKESVNETPVLEDIFSQVIDEIEIPHEEIQKVEDSQSEKDKLLKDLDENGLNTFDFKDEDLKKIMEHYDSETLSNNVATLKSNKIDIKILKDNVELLYDKELAQKIEKLLSLGKVAKDISLMPSVLTKYDLQGLNNTINVLQISGLDPRKVPLMAY